MSIKLIIVGVKGSSKSGNHGHAGIPGKRGGSRPRSAAPVAAPVAVTSLPPGAKKIVTPLEGKTAYIANATSIDNYLSPTGKVKSYTVHKESGEQIGKVEEVYDQIAKRTSSGATRSKVKHGWISFRNDGTRASVAVSSPAAAIEGLLR